MQIRVIADIIESNLATRQDIKGLAHDILVRDNDLKQATSRGIKQPEQRNGDKIRIFATDCRWCYARPFSIKLDLT